MSTILCVDDDPALSAVLTDTLEQAGYRPLAARNVAEALGVLSRESVDLIISDFKMPGLSGLEFLELLTSEGYDVPLIMLTGFASIEHAVEAIKAGAIDYITKPIRAQQLELAVSRALDYVRLRRERAQLLDEVMEVRNARQIVGESDAIRHAIQQVTAAAPTRATVMLQGESGTGKELFARAIHEQSERRDMPFIKLNCAALPEGLIESALFGHERGAFTGAVKRVEGAFERASRGTLLLDEITEMRLDLQAKLLRVLQEQEFERVGGTTPIKVDVRVVATTNRDLQSEVSAGRFRQDLYYRLNVLPIHVPALRERPEDIPILASRFALRNAAELKKEISGFAPAAIEVLQRYSWPGNVRELQHAVERAVILTTDPVLQPHLFDAQRLGAARTTSEGQGVGSGPPAISMGNLPPGSVVLSSLNIGDAEEVLIERALQVTGNNRTRAAELLGISVRTLRNKLNTPEKVAEPN
jgi:DNA-binding NtrC family response regulator